MAKATSPQLPADLSRIKTKVAEIKLKMPVSIERFAGAVTRINPQALLPVEKLPVEMKASVKALKPDLKRFHGAKLALSWFPPLLVSSPCANKFGYLTPAAVRNASKLPFNVANQALLNQLGNLMGDPGREGPASSAIPAGYTYFGQFVDHDITFDVSSSLETAMDATTINNMRSASLDLDSVYGLGPALNPHFFVFPDSEPSTAIKFQLGTNSNAGPGGPSATTTAAGMQVQTDFDVPRMHHPIVPALSSQTAVIGDPRNDENLVVVQFHHAMLKFHNNVVDLLVVAGFTGDVFAEAKKIVTHHYQWAVVHDFLERVCGTAAVTNALATVSAPIDSAFSMPVEFAVAAYRFGHSMIRDRYFVNFNFTNQPLSDLFKFNRKPLLPVLSNWVVDFNAYFDTGVGGVTPNKARKIDSVLANGLEAIPGGSGMMAVLATRNLRRGLALGLPSGQATATHLGVPVLTSAQLQAGLPANEKAVLTASGNLLLQKTPLWYYILREAAVVSNGEKLGPLGAKIVAETFVRMLKRNKDSYLNAAGGFTPFLPSAIAGKFTVADLVVFAGVTQP